MSEPLVTIEDARARVLARATGPLGVEPVAIDDALGRVLAEQVSAAGDVPPFPASAVDGYAVADGSAPAAFTVVGESRAGAPFAGTLAAGQAIRISTGAAVPASAGAVIRQEDVRAAGPNAIATETGVAPGANVRGAGDDMRAGRVVLTAGTRLGPSELGAAVAAGAGRLTVARRPVVAVVCTGDELRAPGAPLAPGEIHNSNAPLLRALSIRSGAHAITAERVGDDRDRTSAVLAAALAECDVLIISGGVSVGPHDHVKPALAALGVEQHFWGVALQPGKPTWFGSRDGRLVFGLPGNPVSTAVTFSLFARPALAALQGGVPEPSPVAAAELAAPVARGDARDQAIRVTLEQRDGRLLARVTGAQDSHMFSSLLAADALAIIPRGQGDLPAGTVVALEPLPGRSA